MAESIVVMSKQASRIDNSIKQRAYTFLEKLGADDAAPGLHIEPIAGCVDERVRTGRVSDKYRAVLFRIDDGGKPYYVVHGVYGHDKAIEVARKTQLRLNPVNGMPNFDEPEQAGPAPAPRGARFAARAEQPAPAEEAAPPLQPSGGGQAPLIEDEPARPLIGVSVDELVNGLGLGAELAGRAAALTDEDALLELAEEVGGWRAYALIDLGAGMSVEQTLADLGLVAHEEAVETTDRALVESLEKPAARMEFAVTEGAEELRAVIESGDFGAWRVFLHPTQRRYVEGHWKGPFRLAGGAGTGKTVVVLHRAAALLGAANENKPRPRVIVTTFTRNMAEELKRGLRLLRPESAFFARGLGRQGAYVTGIDALAGAVLAEATDEQLAEATEELLGAGRSDVSRRTNAQRAWGGALEAAGKGLAPRLRNPSFLQSEYEQIILPGRITTEQEYLRARRPGRGVRLNRSARQGLWRVIERYRADTRLDGTVDYAEAAAIAAACLSRRGPLADHVLIDEGQDLSANHWMLVRALVADGPDDIFIAEDPHQRIYGVRLVLSHYGILTAGRSRRLTLNYRTTAQILRWATDVLAGGHYVDLDEGEDSVEGYRSARNGMKVTLLPARKLTEELDKAADLVRRWLTRDGVAPETIAVLVRSRAVRSLVVSGLGERGVPAVAVDKEAVRPGRPVVMTMHRAKGTEFSRVLLFGVSEAETLRALSAYDYDETERADALLRERSLVYVAASRARDELAVTWVGEASELLGDGARKR